MIAGYFTYSSFTNRKKANNIIELFNTMLDAHQMASSPVVSLPDLRKSLERAKDKGAVWPETMFGYLQHIESKYGAVISK